MARNRVDSDDLELTHEFLSMMLGVRRSGVTVALHLLEKQGIVQAHRGTVRILDRRDIQWRLWQTRDGILASVRVTVAFAGQVRATILRLSHEAPAMPYFYRPIAGRGIENHRRLFKCVGVTRALDTECPKPCSVHNKADVCLHGIHPQIQRQREVRCSVETRSLI